MSVPMSSFHGYILTHNRKHIAGKSLQDTLARLADLALAVEALAQSYAAAHTGAQQDTAQQGVFFDRTCKVRRP